MLQLLCSSTIRIKQPSWILSPFSFANESSVSNTNQISWMSNGMYLWPCPCVSFRDLTAFRSAFTFVLSSYRYLARLVGLIFINLDVHSRIRIAPGFAGWWIPLVLMKIGVVPSFPYVVSWGAWSVFLSRWSWGFNDGFWVCILIWSRRTVLCLGNVRTLIRMIHPLEAISNHLGLRFIVWLTRMYQTWFVLCGIFQDDG